MTDFVRLKHISDEEWLQNRHYHLFGFGSDSQKSINTTTAETLSDCIESDLATFIAVISIFLMSVLPHNLSLQVTFKTKNYN